MTPFQRLTPEQKKLASSIVARYVADKEIVGTMLTQLVSAVQSSQELMALVHSLRWRLKDPTHLKDKLARKMLRAEAEQADFAVSAENVFESINDLAGLRILHLHTTQIARIDEELKKVFAEYKYDIIEDAKARTWDDEYRTLYESMSIATVKSPKMYTSVHYVISPNSLTRRTCEIQVRTLAEELWGEVDHSMNYPTESKVAVCRDQIRVLARLTSSCSRLVDSIYSSSGKKK